MKGLFRKSLFGVRKKDVDNYIIGISENFEKELNELKEQVNKNENESQQLAKSQEELDKKKQAISDAILSAQEQAEKIIADAREKAEAELDEIKRKVMEENKKLIRIRREIYNVRKNTMKVLDGIADGEEDFEDETIE